MVQKEEFREDLYYRLAIFPISIPPLRSRPKDIEPLAISFLEKLNKKYTFQKTLSDASLQLLHEYTWPGNIRELKNIIERAVIISGSHTIEPEDLHIYPSPTTSLAFPAPTEKTLLSAPPIAPIPEQFLPLDLQQHLADIEYTYLTETYTQYGNVRAAAKSLGMSAATFVRKRKLYEKAKDSHTT